MATRLSRRGIREPCHGWPLDLGTTDASTRTNGPSRTPQASVTSPRRIGSTIVQIGKCIYPRFWGGRRRRGWARGADDRQSVWWSGVDTAIAEPPIEGGTPAWADPVVAADHLGVPHRRRGAGSGQALPRRTADRRVVGGCRGRGGGDDRRGSRLP